MITYEDSYAKSLEYFNGDELAASVFLDKYALRDTENNLVEATPHDMHDRLARELARVEAGKFRVPLPFEVIRAYLDRFQKIVPQGSPMYGIGNTYQYVTISNCYVIDIHDSYGAIMAADEQLVQICKRRGGVGLDLSSLRPAGTRVRNAARTSSGLTSFMHRFSNSGREVGQGGRRAAIMLTLSVHHPEVLEFASAKNDNVSVTGANISVRLSNEFLKAVDANEDYEQRYPVDSSNPLISRRVSARAVWKKIIENAHLRAEPGLLFWDNIIRESPADCYAKFGFRSISTNPCTPVSAYVLTSYGIRQIGDVEAGDEIWGPDGWTIITNKRSTGVNRVYKYRTTAGVFYGTPYHRIFENGTKVEVGQAEAMDSFPGSYNSDVTILPEIVMDGLVIGDGSKGKVVDTPVLHIGQDDQDYFSSEIGHLIIKGSFNKKENRKDYKVKTSVTLNETPRMFNRMVPRRYIEGDKNVVCSFLRGLFSANGSLCGGRITLKSSSSKLIEDVQIMLSSVGIRSYFTTNRPTKVRFSNGEYLCKESYDLNITTDRDKFYQIIGFIQKYKMDKLHKLVETIGSPGRIKYSYDIISKDFVSEEETFDITVDNATQSYWNNAIHSSNCSEIPMSIDACRLLAINLFSYVINPFHGSAYFDYDTFYKDAILAQRLMDDIVDLEIESIDRILQKIDEDPEPDDLKYRERSMWARFRKAGLEGRRTGTGITALGDVIAALGVKYGSEESIQITDDIYRTLKLGCYRSSVDMARELGSFPIWDPELEKDCPFLLRIREEDPQLYEDMQKYGRRNIALLTTAPTGTVSTQTQTTSGIEPLFMTHYTRRKKINHNDERSKVDFTDQSGDRWTEYDVYHPKLKMWMEINEETDITKSPYYGATAEEIDWVQRVKLQGVATRHIDHAISSTLNLPEDVSVEKVAEIYETAWVAGLKGITVYRKNCRTGVLVEKREDKIKKTVSIKRPKTLPCDIHHTTYKGEKYYVIVGLLSEDPYEVFAAKDTLSRNIHEGYCIKLRRGVYKLTDTDEEVVSENIAEDCTDDQEAIARLVSTSLRHGADINFIAHQLEKVQGDMHGFAKCIGRVLKKYIPEGTKVNGEVCPECKEDSLIRQSSCSICVKCGWSKCM